jgi:hypothetical protein
MADASPLTPPTGVCTSRDVVEKVAFVDAALLYNLLQGSDPLEARETRRHLGPARLRVARIQSSNTDAIACITGPLGGVSRI